MLKTEGSSNLAMEGCPEQPSFVADYFDDGLTIDADMLFDIIGEGRADDSDDLQNGPDESLKTALENGEMAGSGSQVIGWRNDVVLSDTKKQDMITSNRVQESPINGSSANLRGWISLDSSNGACSVERDDFALPTCGVSSFSQRDKYSLIDGDKLDARTQQHEREIELRNAQDIKSQDILNYHGPGSIATDSYKYGTYGQHTVGTAGLPRHGLCTSLQNPTMEADKSSRDASSVDAMMDFSAVKYDTTGREYPFLPEYNPQFLSDDWKHLGKNREWNFPSESACSSTMIELNGSGIDEKSTSVVPVSNYFDLDGWNHGYECNDYASSSQQSNRAQSYIYHEDKVKGEKPDELTVPSISMQHSDMSYSGVPSFVPQQRIGSLIDEKEELTSVSKKVCRPSDYTNGSIGNITIMNSLDRHIPQIQPLASGNSCVSKVSPESSHSNFSEKSVVEDDPDICIIEDISHPAPRNNIIPAQRSTMESVGSSKSKNKDDRFYMQLMQDLSQPKTEMNPPDGLLSVSLLRHQRIALSWMVQKETDNARCSGGILADDQGLGKTISTISLILKERPLSHKTSPIKHLTETLNLDEDEDVPLVISSMTEHTNAHQLPLNGSPALVVGKGRPAAGTLIVCPTSVLRQWDDELRNKVTKKANLSVLIYHGSNRTKDPCELAKYDVVLTTYSIVAMEVPKQPRADEYDDEKVKMEVGEGDVAELSSTKKRKQSDKKNANKKGVDNSVTESLVRPLAKVGWFRVVLDEAQSIKNHRTQVARACWGLRAKRRWCLSGTPIQNAIDDLYSYFRFLKYDPFDAYKMFCSYIKAPINRSPTNGYRKLQTILRTIMLRRTKGTLLDGEPIINLPPKFVELKKVEFSQEERDFYSRLEADSRAQFEEYAAAGTVKQNYVNILLMLLRLRQACDHPCLVKGVDSRSLLSASAEMAKKLLPNEKEHLLRCLGASLAICGLCNDPPEDAVVAKCGHVFCNQCISEHLTGDEHNCPNPNCKIRLSLSSVFSRNTLSSFLLDHPCKDDSDKVQETKEPPSENLLYSSSKIKAALEVLKTLSGTPDCLGNTTTLKIPSEPLQDGTDSPNIDGEQSFNSSLKVGQKAIVFSQWTRMLDLLEDCLKHSSIQYRRLDGTMSVIARDKAVKDFNTLPEVTVMIMSLKAASLGLNMVAACHVLLLDLWWNPTTEDQAIDRAHRIGQTRPVTVLRLTVRDTVEDRILALQQKKREMVAAAFGDDGSGGGQTRLTEADLKYLFMT